MRLIHWIVFTSLIVGLVSGLPARIHIGGLFEHDDEEMEIVFRTAVDWVNMNHTLLSNSRLFAPRETFYLKNLKQVFLSCKLLEKGLSAIFGPQSEIPSMHVQSICDDLEVLHVQSRWEHLLNRDKLSINLYPNPSVINEAFVRILNLWNWRDFVIVYEEDDAIIRLKDILVYGERVGWNMKLYKFPSSQYYRQTFWKIKNDFEKANTIIDYRIVLDVSRKNLYTVLKSAQQVGMMTEHQKYLITSLDLHTIDLEDFQYGKTNITGVRLVQDRTVLERNRVFDDVLKEVNLRLSRRNSPPLKTLKTEAALMYDAIILFANAMERMDLAKNISAFPPISCQLMNKGIDGTTLFNFMKNTQLQSPGLTGVVRFDVEGFRSEIFMDIIYLTPTGLIEIGNMTWSPNFRWVVQMSQAEAVNTSDFQFVELENRFFRVTTILTDPYVMYRESSKKMQGNARFEGFAIDLLNALADYLHFQYEIQPVKDSKYGRKNPTTGVWDGMIGEVINQDADLAIADVTITTERLTGVDFTLPFMQTGISILFKKPTTKVTSLFSFLSPFSGEVWLLVMAAYTFISISYFLVGRLSPYEWANPHPCRQNDQVEENVFSLLNSMWFAIGSLMQQGSDIAPTAMSTRAITSIWYFFCLIMISSYTANLAAFLTVEKLVSPIENVEDLANQEKIKYGCLGSGSTRGFFQRSNMTTYKRIYQFMEKHSEEVYMAKNSEGINKVKQGNYAYFMEATSIEYNTERECNLTQIGGLLDNKGYGIALRKNSSALRAWLSGGILKLQEQGHLHTFKERWWKEKKGGGSCSQSSKSSGSVNELGLGNVGGVFVVMLLGIVLSAMMGIIEFLWFQRKLQKETDMSLFKLLLREIKCAVTCGSSSKPAPKLKSRKSEEEPTKALPGYNSLY
ncbi:glutamate receptor ionotropic, kainate 2 [Trichonephila inaurata madagascariensis]|uniref:Glutamate receptor ionotropic, kainate 2 n=1 Tax=Trichonephila inaurata madagascariensis TaxID=2747483 RepID=A0A8X6YN83_9ARAC|nr:glutamate receptor ionotropic, kainate 2 [Trichonephila inaurata madagascariensis]